MTNDTADGFAHQGARQLIAQAVKAELNAFRPRAIGVREAGGGAQVRTPRFVSLASKPENDRRSRIRRG